MHCVHPPSSPDDPVSIDVAGLPDLPAQLASLAGGRDPHGAVVVLLDVDGSRVDRILLDGGHDLGDQLDQALASLERARQTIRRLQALG